MKIILDLCGFGTTMCYGILWQLLMVESSWSCFLCEIYEVDLYNCSSQLWALSCGVLQTSILLPLLFILVRHMNSVGELSSGSWWYPILHPHCGYPCTPNQVNLPMCRFFPCVRLIPKMPASRDGRLGNDVLPATYQWFWNYKVILWHKQCKDIRYTIYLWVSGYQHV